MPVTDELEPYTRNVPGVLGDVIEWIMDSGRQPNRVLGMAGAISVIGTLIGRRVAGPTRSGTHFTSLWSPLPQRESNTLVTAPKH